MRPELLKRVVSFILDQHRSFGVGYRRIGSALPRFAKRLNFSFVADRVSTIIHAWRSIFQRRIALLEVSGDVGIGPISPFPLHIRMI